MFKKILSAVLAAMLCIAFTVPAVAANSKVKMSSSSLTMLVGETRTLQVKFTPADTAGSLSWSTGNSKVATVDDSGNVLGIGSGTTTITAKTEGGLTARCNVTVRKEGEKVKVQGLELSTSTLTVRVNQTRMLFATTSPDDATYPDVAWSSSDYNVANVDGEGTVTGIAPGTATITAEADNGYSATCLVTVPSNYIKGLTEDTVTTQLPTGGELITSDEMKTAVKTVASSTVKGTTGTAAFKNKSSIPPAVLNAAAFTATSAGRDIQLQFITTGDDGQIQGWMTVDPQKSKDRTDDLKPGIHTDSAKAVSVASLFNKYYSNALAVIDCDQSGSFKMEVKIAAKVDLSGLSQERLKFYSYNSDANSYDPLVVASYSVDKNGYLRFASSTGGVIIVSDGALIKK